jgi:DNA polymerase/3'-5' exonuclease PolX
MKLNDILSIIKNYDENAVVKGDLTQYVNLNFVPASTKNIIPSGIYYFTGEDFNLKIQ